MRQTDYTMHEKNMKKKWNDVSTKPSTNTRKNPPLLKMRLMRTRETLATTFDCKSIVAIVYFHPRFSMACVPNTISDPAIQTILLIIMADGLVS